MNKLPGALLMMLVPFLLLLPSCKKDTGTQPDNLKVAMLASGTTFDDKAFLQSCKAGFEQAKAEFGLSCHFDIDTTTNRYFERVESYCKGGFDLVIAVGYMWNDAVVQAAKQYPAVRFVLVDAELAEPQANAVSILFDVDQAAFPLGFLSAWWADSHDPAHPAVGYVGALPIPQIRQFIQPFLNGVERYNLQYGRTVAHSGVFTGTFFDPAPGGQAADSLISLGASVIFGVGGETGNSALRMAKARGKQGIGVDVDQYVSLPEVSGILLSSAMKGLDHAIYAVVRSFVKHAFDGGGIYTGTLANEGVEIAPYHDYETQIPDSMKTEIGAILTGIMNGSISTGWAEGTGTGFETGGRRSISGRPEVVNGQ